VERSQRVVAAGEVAQVVEIGRAVGGELVFDQPDGLLVVVGEQSHEGVFLRMHGSYAGELSSLPVDGKPRRPWRLVTGADLRDVQAP
jgi:hypothetical protein